MSDAAAPPPADLLEALRAARGTCPEPGVLLEPEALAPEEREELERHLALCPTCEAIVRPELDEPDDHSWARTAKRLDARTGPWTDGRRQGARLRGLLALAAVLILSVAGVLLLRDSASEPPPPPSTLRGGVIQLLEPVGPVASVERLRWRTTGPLSLDCRVEVRRGDAVVWTGQAAGSEIEAPAALQRQLVPGAPHEWRVIARTAAGEVLHESPWVAFTPGAVDP